MNAFCVALFALFALTVGDYAGKRQTLLHRFVGGLDSSKPQVSNANDAAAPIKLSSVLTDRFMTHNDEELIINVNSLELDASKRSSGITLRSLDATLEAALSAPQRKQKRYKKPKHYYQRHKDQQYKVHNPKPKDEIYTASHQCTSCGDAIRAIYDGLNPKSLLLNIREQEYQLSRCLAITGQKYMHMCQTIVKSLSTIIRNKQKPKSRGSDYHYYHKAKHYPYSIPFYPSLPCEFCENMGFCNRTNPVDNNDGPVMTCECSHPYEDADAICCQGYEAKCSCLKGHATCTRTRRPLIKADPKERPITYEKCPNACEKQQFDLVLTELMHKSPRKSSEWLEFQIRSHTPCQINLQSLHVRFFKRDEYANPGRFHVLQNGASFAVDSPQPICVSSGEYILLEREHKGKEDLLGDGLLRVWVEEQRQNYLLENTLNCPAGSSLYSPNYSSETIPKTLPLQCSCQYSGCHQYENGLFGTPGGPNPTVLTLRSVFDKNPLIISEVFSNPSQTTPSVNQFQYFEVCSRFFNDFLYLGSDFTYCTSSPLSPQNCASIGAGPKSQFILTPHFDDCLVIAGALFESKRPLKNVHYDIDLSLGQNSGDLTICSSPSCVRDSSKILDELHYESVPQDTSLALCNTRYSAHLAKPGKRSTVKVAKQKNGLYGVAAPARPNPKNHFSPKYPFYGTPGQGINGCV